MKPDPHSLVVGVYSLLSDNFLLAADYNEIVQVDTATLNEYRLTVVNVTSLPQVLAYDWRHQIVYWTSEIKTSVIFKYSFVDRNTSVVYHDPARMITTYFVLLLCSCILKYKLLALFV